MALKLAIVGSGTTQRRLSRRVRIAEVRLSEIVHGRTVATAQERQRLARALGADESVLFEVAS